MVRVYTYFAEVLKIESFPLGFEMNWFRGITTDDLTKLYNKANQHKIRAEVCF